MCEASSTLAADIRPLTCVYPHVLPEVGRLGERFVTHCAGVRLETKMDILVSPQTTGVLEGLWACVTGVWTLSSMLPQVILVMRTPFKGQRTIRAHEGTYSSVDALMDLGLDKRRDEKPLFICKHFILQTQSFIQYKICHLEQ